MEGIVETPDVLGGEPRLSDGRIDVPQVTEMVIEEGMPPVEVASQLEIELGRVRTLLSQIDEMGTSEASPYLDRQGRAATQGRCCSIHVTFLYIERRKS